MLAAAEGVRTTAKPTKPTIAMANATGMLLASSTSRPRQPNMPISIGVMA